MNKITATVFMFVGAVFVTAYAGQNWSPVGGVLGFVLWAIAGRHAKYE